MKTCVQGFKRNLGYTIDQTILIVAVIAVLITLIIASVGWDLLARAGGTKLASYFKQIENANGQFYAKMGVWPHDALAQAGTASMRDAEGNIVALKDRSAFPSTAGGARYYNRFQDYLEGFTTTGSAGSMVVVHTFGNGGNISQEEDSANCPGNASFLRVMMTNIPQKEIEEADESIDNGDGASTGRLRWGSGTTSVNNGTITNGIANVAYCANNVGY